MRARASCVLAGALLPVGELARAEALYQQGLNELPRDPRFSLDQAFCLLRGSEAAFHQGKLERGNQIAQSPPNGHSKSRPFSPNFRN